MGDDEIEEMLAELRAMCDAATSARAEEILSRLDEAPAIEMGETTCILLGYDGQVDVAWDVPDPRPLTLLRPLALPTRRYLIDEDNPVVPLLRTARYDRVGEFTYRRVE